MIRRVLVALGGNSLTRQNEVGTIEEQFHNTRETCRFLATIVERGWEIVITHGNGPQVGNVMRRMEMTAHKMFPVPLDVCDAKTQGAMGYMIQQCLSNELHARGIHRRIATFITQTVVAEDDPGFHDPQKPIGRFFTEEQAKAKAAKEGWEMREDSGRGWRRVVASPMPLAIVESDAIAQAVSEVIPIAVGGGGIPVVERDGCYYGVEAVVDKDRASALLALDLKCDLFVILTAVDVVQVGYGTPQAKALHRVSRDDMRKYMAAGEFAPGSMLPKVESVLTYLDGGGKQALITDPDNLEAALEAKAGTIIE